MDELDLARLERDWRYCPYHDAGGMGCSCPEDNPRDVIRALLAHIDRIEDQEPEDHTDCVVQLVEVEQLRDALQVERDRALVVVRAAEAWRATRPGIRGLPPHPQTYHLVRAVDSYRVGGETP